MPTRTGLASVAKNSNSFARVMAFAVITRRHRNIYAVEPEKRFAISQTDRANLRPIGDRLSKVVGFERNQPYCTFDGRKSGRPSKHQSGGGDPARSAVVCPHSPKKLDVGLGA